MYLLTRKFWSDLRSDPREAVDSLKQQKSRFWYYVVKFIVFWRIVFSEYGLNHCMTRASAIAFTLLLTLIPLVVTTAFMLASLVEVRSHQVEQFFGTLLPFAPQTVLNYISAFFVNAQKLRGWGIAVLLFVAVGLFGVAEEAFNTIWKVSRPRSFFARLRTFTLVMVWSPILFFFSFQIRRARWLEFASNYFYPVDFLPFLLMALAFTCLILFVPNTKVRFGSALLGGLVAGLLFEAEREGYGKYVHMSIQTQTIYGAFGILPLFLVSLFVVSLFVLFGVEVAYVHQNFRPLLRATRRWDRRVGDYKTYLTLRIFIDAVSAFQRKQDPPTIAFYSRKYDLTEPQALGLLSWLVHAKLLHSTGNRDRYVPTRDFSRTPLMEVLDEIKAQDLRVPATPDDYTREFVASILNNCQRGAKTPADQITFDALVQNLEEGEKRFSNVTAIV